MIRRVRIEIAGAGTRWVARVPMDNTIKLTKHKRDARHYRSTLNADLDAQAWERTLRELGLDADAYQEVE